MTDAATRHTIHTGDAREILATLPDNTFDAMLCDPPYGLRFMGKAWDYDVPTVATWREALRVLKPGAFALVACGTRTQHRMVVNLEDAGFEVRDVVAWLYGSGFPKSHDVSKAIDQNRRGAMIRTKLLHFAEARGVDGRWLESRGVASAASFADWTVGGHVPGEKNWRLVKDALGVTEAEERAFEREVIGRSANGIAGGTGQHTGQDGAYGFQGEFNVTAPATPDAARWAGYGTALKPAMELWTLVRKPPEGTVAANCLRHGVGGLNIDGTRIPFAGAEDEAESKAKNQHGAFGSGPMTNAIYGAFTADRGDYDPPGRWPANVVHDGSDEVLAGFPDTQSGTWNGQMKPGATPNGHLAGKAAQPYEWEGDFGSAARFFYVAKADTSERDAGLTTRNPHPTVKPITLTTYLARLILPPERDTPRRILVPFAGSGSEMIGARLAGWDHATGIELDPEYARIAQARLTHHTNGSLW